MKRKYELLALGLMFVAVSLVSMTAIFGVALNEVRSKGLYDALKDWQTLIAGFLALGAAGIAVYPVWKQVLKMNLQSAIMSRNVLVNRSLELEKRRNSTRTLLDDMATDFVRAVFPFDPEDDSEFDPEWAFNAQKRVEGVVDILNSEQNRKRDPSRIDGVRHEVVVSLAALGECLDDIHRPHSTDFDDPELNFTEERIEAIHAASLRGQQSFSDRISAVTASGLKLDEAFGLETDRLKNKIREIDDLIVDDELRA